MTRKRNKRPEEIQAKIKYKGQKSKRGNYFPYVIQPNDYGIVGTVYIPVDKEIPHNIKLTTGGN